MSINWIATSSVLSSVGNLFVCFDYTEWRLKVVKAVKVMLVSTDIDGFVLMFIGFE